MACNTGVSLTPTVAGETHHFRTTGIYNGLSMLRDAETGSIWNHITGDAVYGPLMGERLPIYNLLHTSVEALLASDPDAWVAISDRPIRRRPTFRDRVPFLRQGFRETIVEEDTRRPTMEIGLGVWAESGARFYPLETVQASNGALIDDFDGKRLLVYVEPGFGVLAAYFVESSAVDVDGSEIRLAGGVTVRDGVLTNQEGEPIDGARPMQMFTRWYGFALTFPETDIFGG